MMRFTLASNMVLVLGVFAAAVSGVGQELPTYTPERMPNPRTRYQESGDRSDGFADSQSPRWAQLNGSRSRAERNSVLTNGPGAPPQYAGDHVGPILPTPHQGGEHPQHLPHAPYCGGDACGFADCGLPRTGWFGGVYGLVMTRDNADDVWLSYDTADIRRRVLTTRDADAPYSGGFETRLGRYFNGGNNALEMVYWGIFPAESEANVLATEVSQELDTILHFDGISFDNGAGEQLVSTGFFDAERHRVQRDWEFHNVEVNLLGNDYLPCGGCSRLRLGWLAGFRYIKFDDDFLFSADREDIKFTGDPREVHYGIDVENHLIGFQVGGRADYCLFGGLSTFVDSKVGVYNNHIDHRSQIRNSKGFAEVSDPGNPHFGEAVDIRTDKDDIAVVAELRTGLNYRFGRWAASAGYRAVGLTGVALSTDQIPRDFIAALDSVRKIDSNGSLIVHGAFAGLEYNY